MRVEGGAGHSSCSIVDYAWPWAWRDCLVRGGVGGGELIFLLSSLSSSLVEWRVPAVPWLTAVPTVEIDVEMGAD